jgi:hypothetical protein
MPGSVLFGSRPAPLASQKRPIGKLVRNCKVEGLGPSACLLAELTPDTPMASASSVTLGSSGRAAKSGQVDRDYIVVLGEDRKRRRRCW